MGKFLAAAVLLFTVSSIAIAQVDLADAAPGNGAELIDVQLRMRVTRCQPERMDVSIAWRRGGEGLGGTVTKGMFQGEKGESAIELGAWSGWLPLTQVAGKGGGWKFPTIMISAPDAKKRETLTGVSVEFQFSRKGTPFKTFIEEAPKGGTAGFGVPGGARSRAEFEEGLQGLSAHAHARRERLEKALGAFADGPKKFGVIGHLAGYGEGVGYGIRHCNPDIVKEECMTLRLLGMNGMVDERSLDLADAAGVGEMFRHTYWGSSGVGSPDGFFRKKSVADSCPFDPALHAAFDQSSQKAAAKFAAFHAQENWAIAWDEIGVAAKDHINTCPRCAEEFRAYLKMLKREPADFGKQSWEQVSPYPIWIVDPAAAKKGPALAPAPGNAPDALRYYYTFRFMTYATADLFPQAAQNLLKSNVRMYAMHGPTPSWGGHSLDWHEFYDLGANTALVWETSNRDARAWQWESYMADLMRGISQRHDLPIGVLVKPHRGAPAQRMLAAVTRGAERFEWYTYGPDYAKGDSFSQSPQLLEMVARADRFLASAEDALYGAKWAGRTQVAFVTPRSSEIWGKVSPFGVANFEDAKWVYMALAHTHVPVDILSEQQLAEGKLADYKAAYIVGPSLARDAGKELRQWINAGGTLWTDGAGLSLDEANQPAAIADMLPANRVFEKYADVESYHAVALKPFTGESAPPSAKLTWDIGGAWGRGEMAPNPGRVLFDPAGADVLAKFADGKPAIVRRKVGKGEVISVGLWAGLSYSERVRRPDFDMRADFDAAARNLISAVAVEKAVYRPVVPSEPLVEAVLLDNHGRKSVALINWAYRTDKSMPNGSKLEPMENVAVLMRGVAGLKSVHSIGSGELPIQGQGDERTVVVPRIGEVDLLVLE